MNGSVNLPSNLGSMSETTLVAVVCDVMLVKIDVCAWIFCVMCVVRQFWCIAPKAFLGGLEQTLPHFLCSCFFRIRHFRGGDIRRYSLHGRFGVLPPCAAAPLGRVPEQVLQG